MRHDKLLRRYGLHLSFPPGIEIGYDLEREDRVLRRLIFDDLRRVLVARTLKMFGEDHLDDTAPKDQEGAGFWWNNRNRSLANYGDMYCTGERGEQFSTAGFYELPELDEELLVATIQRLNEIEDAEEPKALA